jgi:hypothetical protein
MDVFVSGNKIVAGLALGGIVLLVWCTVKIVRWWDKLRRPDD